MTTSKDFIVKHNEDLYNISDFFAKHHPGGKNYIQPYENADITSKMQHTQHSRTAYHLLEQYRVTERSSGSKGHEEDLETLVDWNKPMVGQVHLLGKKYKEWVHLPVDRKMRIFGNPILEYFTISSWYMVLTWIPIVIFFVFYGTQKYVHLTKDVAPVLPVLLSIVTGMFIWTTLEYFLHRWVFHMEPSGKSAMAIYIHFFLHGIHHKIPFDSERIIFPFLPATVIAFIIFQTLALFAAKSSQLLVFAGVLIGYVIYESFHCYLHHSAPEEETYLYKMKRYHNQHHFVRHDLGFGVTSVIWDRIFGSALTLRKLAVAVKW